MIDGSHLFTYLMRMNPFFACYPAPVAVPVAPPTPSVDPQGKKYQRTWKKQEIEQAFSKASQFAEESNKRLEELTLKDFEIIGASFTQSPKQIMLKVNEIHKSGTLRPGIWSKTEDDLLQALIQKSKKKWGKIAAVLNKEVHNNLNIRSGKQCKERWNNYLNPEVERGPWKLEDDVKVLKSFKEFGKKWSLITRLVKNRTESAVKKIKQNLNSIDRVDQGIDEFIKKSETQSKND
jgi:hypothetical protein